MQYSHHAIPDIVVTHPTNRNLLVHMPYPTAYNWPMTDKKFDKREDNPIAIHGKIKAVRFVIEDHLQSAYGKCMCGLLSPS